MGVEKRRKEVTFIKNILILMKVNDLGSKNSYVSQVERWHKEPKLGNQEIRLDNIALGG
jgi:hypothetical protein